MYNADSSNIAEQELIWTDYFVLKETRRENK